MEPRLICDASGLGLAAAALRATFPAALQATAARVTLARCPGAPAPELLLPPSLSDMVAAALALEEADSKDTADKEAPARAARLRLLYLDLLPSQRVEQLLVKEGPAARLLHTPVDWRRAPHIGAAVRRLIQIFAAAGAAPFPSGLLDACPTVGALYERAYYGRYLPLLGGSAPDLARMAAMLDSGEPLEAVLDRELCAPLVHELSHGARDRWALGPPYLDECVASYLGLRALRALCYPQEGGPRPLYAAPWLAQVGQALVRAFGLAPVVAAHAGVATWDALCPGLAAAAARLGFAAHRARREPHFLGSARAPAPWLKFFFLAASGADLQTLDWEALCALPWEAVPVGPSDDEDRDAEMVIDGLLAGCLRGGVGEEVRLMPGPLRIDLYECSTAPADAPGAPAYLFPPAVAARLREQGLAALSVTLDDLAALPALTVALADGTRSRRGPGYAIVAHLSR